MEENCSSASFCTDDSMIRLMKQTSYTLELQQDHFKKTENTPAMIQKLRNIGTDIVNDLILELLNREDLPPQQRSSTIIGFMKFVRGNIAKYATPQTEEITWNAILVRFLRLMDKPSPIRAGLVIAYHTIDPHPMPFIFQLLESEDELVVQHSSSAITNFTALFYLKEGEMEGGGGSGCGCGGGNGGGGGADEGKGAGTGGSEVEGSGGGGCGGGGETEGAALNHNHSPSELGKSSSAFTDVTQLLQQLDVDLLDPGEILGCTAEQMRKYFPIFFTHLESQKNRKHITPIIIRGWNAFLHRVHMDPYLSQMFYWIASVDKLITSRILNTELQIFLTSHEVLATQAFFEELNQGWSNTITLEEEKETDFIDPLSETCNKVVEWQVVKVFESKARPLLLKFKYNDGTSNFVICKKGDDLRQDFYVQTLFTVFNELWAISKMDLKPFIHTYKCVPLSENFGLIECVQNVVSVKNFNWETLKKLEENKLHQFISSLAGSYLASFVLGIRDRHQDNMLVKDDYIFFHVDFGHLWNNKPLVDAPRIAVPDEVKLTLTPDKWWLFEKILEEGFLVLHRFGKQIENTATTLFRQITDPKLISAFLESDKSLMIDLSCNEALLLFKSSLAQSLKSVGKKFKDSFHNSFSMSSLGRSAASSPRVSEILPSKRIRCHSSQAPRRVPTISPNNSPCGSPQINKDKPSLPPSRTTRTTPNRKRGSDVVYLTSSLTIPINAPPVFKDGSDGGGGGRTKLFTKSTGDLLSDDDDDDDDDEDDVHYLEVEVV